MDSLRWVRFSRFTRLYRAVVVRDTFAPLFNRGELFRTLSIPIFLVIVFLAQGKGVMNAELGSWSASQLALIWTIPFYLIIVAAVSPFKVLRMERAKGRWFGNRFVYHE